MQVKYNLILCNFTNFLLFFQLKFTGNDGDGFELNSTQSNFSISIVLTQSGFQDVDQVLLAVFSYLKMLNEEGPNQRIFQEIKEIEDLNFKFKEESQPMDNVEHLCENMQKYPSELIITGKRKKSMP